MRARVTTPPTSLPVNIDALVLRMNLDDSPQVRSVLADMAAEATSYAEHGMQASLMQQTITAEFYSDDLISERRRIELELPYGPVLNITSVRLNGVDIDYRQLTIGNSDRIVVEGLHVLDSDLLTVVYTAGHDDASTIDADVLGTIRGDVATRWQYREHISDRPVNVVRNIDAFYAARSRVCPIA